MAYGFHLYAISYRPYANQIFTALNGMDRRQPELAHLNNAAVREAKMFCRSVSDPALADLRRGVLAVNRCHVEFYLRSAHERRRLRCVPRRPYRRFAVFRRIEFQYERVSVVVVHRHAPGDIGEIRIRIAGQRAAVVDDKNWRWVGNFAMPFFPWLRSLAARNVAGE